MAAEAEATREARAKVIAAEGEQRASCALKEAAFVIADSSAALQLRYLQTLSSIAAENNSTIVFPVPMELLRGFLQHDGEHQEHEDSKHHHHSHHHPHHHSNHVNHLHEPTGVFEDLNNNKMQLVCDEDEKCDQFNTGICHLPPPPQTTLSPENYREEEYLHSNELEASAPKFKGEYKTE